MALILVDGDLEVAASLAAEKTEEELTIMLADQEQDGPPQASEGVGMSDLLAGIDMSEYKMMLVV